MGGYKPELTLNNLQGLICHETQVTNQSIFYEGLILNRIINLK